MTMTKYGARLGLSRAREEGDVWSQQRAYEAKIAELEKKKADEEAEANKLWRQITPVAGAVVGAVAGAQGGPAGAAAGMGAGLGVGNAIAGIGLKDSGQSITEGIAASQQGLSALAQLQAQREGLKAQSAGQNSLIQPKGYMGSPGYGPAPQEAGIGQWGTGTQDEQYYIPKGPYDT